MAQQTLTTPQLMQKIWDYFKTGATPKHVFQTGAADAPGGLKITQTGSADQFLSAGLGFGGRTLFPYRSGQTATFERQSRITQYIEMDFDTYASAALTILSDFVCEPDEDDNIITVDCDNEEVKKILESLFFDVLDIEGKLPFYTRTLCKYGDFFALVNWHPKHGVTDLYPMPVHEVEREEGFDERDPMAVRFKWATHAHRKLSSWEVLHFRLLENELYLPYGTSVLSSATRAFNQYLMLFDAISIYRITRAPERLVFRIDVGGIPPEDVPQFMKEQQDELKTATVIDSSNSIADRRYDPMNVTEDYFVAKRGDQGSEIIQLPGGTVQGDTDDIELALNRFLTGLRVPRPYLDFSEEWAKANIANLDIRFAKTVRKVQLPVISELTKVGLIHLITMGYEGKDLFDWELKMTNPSNIAELQKLEMWEKRLNIVQSAKQTEIICNDYIFENILHLSDEDKKENIRGLIKDKAWEQAGEKVVEKFMERQGGEEGEEEPAPDEPGGEKKEESKSAYGIPQTKKLDLGLPDSEELLKRTIPNDGDGIEDPYDRNFFKKTATSIADSHDALEEAGKFVLEKEGQLIVTTKENEISEEKRSMIQPVTVNNRMVEDIKAGLALKKEEILIQESLDDTEVIVSDDEDIDIDEIED